MDEIGALLWVLFIPSASIAAVSWGAVYAEATRHATLLEFSWCDYWDQFVAFSLMSIVWGTAIIIKRFWGSSLNVV